MREECGESEPRHRTTRASLCGGPSTVTERRCCDHAHSEERWIIGSNERGVRDVLTLNKPQEVEVKCLTAQFNYVDIAQKLQRWNLKIPAKKLQ
jgi:hypothetical protein